MSFDKQLSREKYHQVFVRKQEDHKVPSNTYDVNHSLTRERVKAPLFDPNIYERLTFTS